MNRESRKKQLFRRKTMAICGVAICIGCYVNGLNVDAQYTDSIEENTYAQIENIVYDGIASMPAVMEEEAEDSPECRERVEDKEECQEIDSDIKWDAADGYLLRKIAMAEAENEGVEGKALVMLVVINRVKSDKFPDTVSKVIFQENQFSPVFNGRFFSIEPDKECHEALELIHTAKWDESQGALYFESEGESDWHKDNLDYLFQHGNHYFYTDKEKEN